MGAKLHWLVGPIQIFKTRQVPPQDGTHNGPTAWCTAYYSTHCTQVIGPHVNSSYFIFILDFLSQIYLSFSFSFDFSSFDQLLLRSAQIISLFDGFYLLIKFLIYQKLNFQNMRTIQTLSNFYIPESKQIELWIVANQIICNSRPI